MVGMVFLVTPPNPNQVVQAKNGIRAAQQAGRPYLVRLSAGSAPGSPARVSNQHDEIDEELRASGLAYTILKPHFFMQNTLMAEGSVASQGVVYMPLADARIGRIDFRDISDVVAKALTVEGHQGKTYLLTGPASISFHAVAAGLSKALGREVRYIPVALEAAKEAMVGMGLSEWFVDALNEYSQALRAESLIQARHPIY